VSKLKRLIVSRLKKADCVQVEEGWLCPGSNCHGKSKAGCVLDPELHVHLVP